MASSSSSFLSLFVVAALLAIIAPASARPCKTLLISFSSTSFSSDSESGSQTLTVADFPRRAATFVAIFRIRRLGPHHHHHLHSFPADPRRSIQIQHPELPHHVHHHRHDDHHPIASRFALGLGSSLQERAKDILVVVVGLLFGVGCGALTAASMYLVWSVIAGAGGRGGMFGSDDGYGELTDDDDEEEESPKKAGFVAINDVDAEKAAAKEEYVKNQG